MKPIARPKRNPLRIPSHPQSPNNGALFVFARPSQRIATPAPAKSPVPTDVTGNRLTAPAHTETRPAPPPSTQRTADGQHLHSKCIPCPQDRLKTTSEAQKQIFGPYCNFFAIADCRGAPNRGSQPKNTANRPLNGSSPPCREVRGSAIAKKLQKSPIFCFYEAILRDKTNFQRPDHHNEAASQRTDCLSQKIPQRQIATTSSESRLFQ